MIPLYSILEYLFAYGPQTWVELCAAMGTDETGKDSPVYEPLEHLIELGVVRTAMIGTHNLEIKYKATDWKRQSRLTRRAA